LKAIEYETSLECLRKQRSDSLGYRKTTVSDLDGLRRISMLYDRATKLYHDEIEIWYAYIDFCMRSGQTKKLHAIVLRALRFHSAKPQLWLLAAERELKTGNFEAARALCVRGLRFLPDNVKMWQEYFRIELNKARVLTQKSAGGGEKAATDLFAVPKVVLRQACSKLKTDANCAAFLQKCYDLAEALHGLLLEDTAGPVQQLGGEGSSSTTSPQQQQQQQQQSADSGFFDYVKQYVKFVISSSSSSVSSEGNASGALKLVLEEADRRKKDTGIFIFPFGGVFFLFFFCFHKQLKRYPPPTISNKANDQSSNTNEPHVNNDRPHVNDNVEKKPPPSTPRSHCAGCIGTCASGNGSRHPLPQRAKKTRAKKTAAGSLLYMTISSEIPPTKSRLPGWKDAKKTATSTKRAPQNSRSLLPSSKPMVVLAAEVSTQWWRIPLPPRRRHQS